MKRNIFLGSVLALLLSAAILPNCAAEGDTNVFGSAVDPATANRAIFIGTYTESVNVTSGEAIRFVVGDKSFGWRFDGSSRISEIDLNKIAPPGVLNRTVKVYIQRNPERNGA